MPKIRIISLNEAQQTRTPKPLGVRKQRMAEFDAYVADIAALGSDEALVIDELSEDPQRFVPTLRGALKRAGVAATVKKPRLQPEVRVWLDDSAVPVRPARERELVAV